MWGIGLYLNFLKASVGVWPIPIHTPVQKVLIVHQKAICQPPYSAPRQSTMVSSRDLCSSHHLSLSQRPPRDTHLLNSWRQNVIGYWRFSTFWKQVFLTHSLPVPKVGIQHWHNHALNIDSSIGTRTHSELEVELELEIELDQPLADPVLLQSSLFSTPQ